MSSKQRLKQLQAKARRAGRLKNSAATGPAFGSIDPLSGRRVEENIDRFTPAEKESMGIPGGTTNAEYRAATRRKMIALGLPPVGHLFELTDEEWRQYCRLTDFDSVRDDLDLPCNSWDFTLQQEIQCSYWHCKVQRGEMTREEYHRLVLEMAGLPPPAAAPPAETPSGGGECVPVSAQQ